MGEVGEHAEGEVGEHADSRALRRRAFLKQAVLSGATLQLGGLLGSALIAPASAQATSVLITGETTILITGPTTVLLTNPTTIRITNPTDSTTVPITFFQPSDTPPTHAVPGPSTLSLLLAAAGVSGAAALVKRLRAASSLQEPTPSEDDKVD